MKRRKFLFFLANMRIFIYFCQQKLPKLKASVKKKMKKNSQIYERFFFSCVCYNVNTLQVQ